MTRTKKLVRGVGITLGAVILALVLLVAFFPRQRIVALAESRIERATGQEVEIGSSSLGLFPRVRLELGQVRIGTPNDSAKPSMQLESLVLGVRLAPLLGRRVVVSELVARKPRIEMTLADSTAASKAPPASGGQSSPGLAVQVDKLEITDGEILVRRADGATLFEIHDLSEELRASADAGGLVSLEGTTRVPDWALHLPTGIFGKGVALELAKRLRFDLGADRLTIDEGSLRISGLPVSVTGTIDGVRAKEKVAAIELHGGPGNVDTIVGLLPEGLFPALDGMTSRGVLSVNGKLAGSLSPTPGPAFDLAIALRDGFVSYPGKGAVSDITLDLRATQDSLVVNELRAGTAGSSFRAHAAVTQYRTDPHVRAALEANVSLADATLFNPQLEPFALGGAATAQVFAEGPASRPNDLEIHGTVHARDVTTRVPNVAVPVTNITGDIVFDGHRATTSALTGRIGPGTVRVSGSLTNPLALNPALATKGRATLTANARGDRLDMNVLMPEPQGSDGAAQGGAAAKKLPPLPPLDGTLTASFDTFSMRKLDATEARGTFALRNDVLSLSEVRMRTFGGTVELGGSIDLENVAAPRFDLTTKATGCRIGDLFAFNEKLERFSGVASFLKGTMSTTATMKGALDDTLGLDLPSFLSIGDLEVRQATLEGHPAQAALAQYLKAEGFRKLAILELLQPFRIENGRLNLQGLSLRTSELELVGSGWSDLTGRYELSLEIGLPKSWASGLRDEISPDIAALAFGGSGDRLVVPIAIAGQGQEKPSIRLDQEKLAAGARERATARLAEERKKLEEEAKRRAAEAAAGLFDAKTDTAETVQEAAKEKVEEKVKDVLDNIFGGKKK